MLLIFKFQYSGILQYDVTKGILLGYLHFGIIDYKK